MEVILPLPTEIWSEVFSYLDGKSRKSVAATCNQFLCILRGNEKTSGQITLKIITLKNLSKKIESAEWNWERWPCLKSIRIPLSFWKNPYKNQYYGSSSNTALDPLKMMKFEQCPSLERLLIFNCGLPMKIDTIDASTRYGIAKELCINPRYTVTNLSFKILSHLHIDHLENIDCDTLRQIGKTANQLSRLTISLRPTSCLHEMLNGLTLMFEGLKYSLKTVCLQLNYHNYDCSTNVQALLKSLNENCPSLESLHIKARTKDAEEFLKGFENYYCYPNLRELIVPKLKHISAFIRDSKSLTTLIVHSVTTAEFNNIHLQRICDKLHDLKYCRIFLTNFHQFKTYSKWSNFIDENFHQQTKVVIYQKKAGPPIFFYHPPCLNWSGDIEKSMYWVQLESILLKLPYKKTTPISH